MTYFVFVHEGWGEYSNLEFATKREVKAAIKKKMADSRAYNKDDIRVIRGEELDVDELMGEKK